LKEANDTILKQQEQLSGFTCTKFSQASDQMPSKKKVEARDTRELALQQRRTENPHKNLDKFLLSENSANHFNLKEEEKVVSIKISTLKNAIRTPD